MKPLQIGFNRKIMYYSRCNSEIIAESIHATNNQIKANIYHGDCLNIRYFPRIQHLNNNFHSLVQ